MFLLLRQVVHDALALEVPWKRLPATGLLMRNLLARAGLGAVVIVIATIGPLRCLCFRLPRLPGCREQRQLIRRELLTFAVPLGIQQLAQQTLDLLSLPELTTH